MEIQDFMLANTGVQTINRARRVFEAEVKKWEDLFLRESVEYFGKRYVEMDILKVAIEKQLQHIDLDARKKLYYMLSDKGE